jgi:hypothetical protein
MGLVPLAHRFAQWRDHGSDALVLGSRCDGWRSSTAISNIWKLLKLIRAEMQSAEDELASGLHGACIVGCERVLGRQTPMRP